LPATYISESGIVGKLYLVDDDEDIRELLTDYLSNNGYEVSAFESGEALLAADMTESDLLILDIGLPGIDGFEVCRRVRKDSSIPILMLTAASDDIDRILGLELGADDYMSKPFNPRVLLARIKAMLRRTALPNRVEEVQSQSKSLIIDNLTRKAQINGHEIELTGAEFDLLSVLAKHQGQVVSREILGLEIKGRPITPYDRSIDTQISRLRTKLTQFCNEDPIKSVRGKGYLLTIL